MASAGSTSTFIPKRGMVGCSVLLMAIFGYGLTRIETSIKLQDLFSPRSRVIEDYRWLERNIGPLVPMEVIIRFDRSCKLDLLGRVDMVRRVGAHDHDGISYGVDNLSTVAAPPWPRSLVGGDLPSSGALR